MNDTAAHAFFGAPFGDPDPETGLPTVELQPDIAAALAAAGWHRDPANIENEYVEGDWVLDTAAAGPIPRCYSIEPSGHHRSVIVHRGPVCDSPVFSINVTGTTPIPPTVVLAAVNALIVDDVNTEIPGGGLPAIEAVVASAGEGDKVADLMAALEQSLAAARTRLAEGREGDDG